MNDFKTIAEIAANIGVSRQAVYLKLKNNDLSNAVKPFTESQGKVTRYSIKGVELIKEAFANNPINSEVKQLTNSLTESQENCQELSSNLQNCQAELEKSVKELEQLREKVKSLETANAELLKKSSGLDNLTNKCQELEKSCEVLETTLSEKKNYISALEADKERANESIDDLKNQLKEKEASAKEEREKERQERQTILTRLWQTEDKNKALETELNKYKALADSKGESQKGDEQPVKTQIDDPPQPEPQPKQGFFKRLFSKRS